MIAQTEKTGPGAVGEQTEEAAPVPEWPPCLVDARSIAARVAELGEELSRRFARTRPVLLGVLTGAYMFLADLSRQVRVPHEIALVRASSYGDAATPAPQIALQGLRPAALQGRDVVIVEDLLDTGHTLRTIIDTVRNAGAASVMTCVLVVKDRGRPYPVQPDLVGFVVPPLFVVGYGIDYARAWRHLPYLGWVRPEEEHA